MRQLPSIETRFNEALADDNGLDEIDNDWNTLLDVVFPASFPNTAARTAYFAKFGDTVQNAAATLIGSPVGDFTSDQARAASLMGAVRNCINDKDATRLAAIQDVAFDNVNAGKGANSAATFSNWLSIITYLLVSLKFKNTK